MAIEWDEVHLGSDCVEIIDGDRGHNYPKVTEFTPEGHCLFLNAGNVTDKGFDFATCSFITEQRDNALRKGKLRRYDSVLTTRGTVGNVAYYDGKVPFRHIRINSGMVILRPDAERILPEFLYLFLRSHLFHSQLLQLTTGSAQPQLPIRDIRRIKMMVPPLAEQHRIVAVTKPLDDKIELNRHLNHTLEAIARAIFKSWFVDFDPVWANMEGRPYPLDPATLALFPATFENSELGAIPAGWRAAPLKKHITAIRGLSYKGSGLSDDGQPLHNLNSFLRGGGYNPEGVKYYKGDFRSRHVVQAGELIVANTDITQDRRVIGFAAIVPSYFGDEGLFSHHLYRVVPRETSNLSPLFLYHMFVTPTYHSLISNYANGTTVEMLPAVALELPLVIVPPRPIVERFTELARPLHTLVEQNFVQSETLRNLRDTLLPRLISGELRVPAAAALVEEVAP